jgi:hypothetical protein
VRLTLDFRVSTFALVRPTRPPVRACPAVDLAYCLVSAKRNVLGWTELRHEPVRRRMPAVLGMGIGPAVPDMGMRNVRKAEPERNSASYENEAQPGKTMHSLEKTTHSLTGIVPKIAKSGETAPILCV